ncbi:ribosomal protein L11 methyltransferase [Thiothrix eikelboomii]|uniref:Ribosomal protein L11 methyltransferase n=1 Tax=Thiothrix eikelboomii TaxID=92487 RepID=A0A1T4XT90_9GAMM|nr:50S ribosomal protein L11 methyltransferase [Thiothrix eikelboomii]SKA92315.1 ribosomal protein L11 methyltransferase [Thiothrix eikelboomii]
MTWQQLICHTTVEHQEAISAALEEAGAASVTFEDAVDQPILEPLPGETPLWDLLVITGLYPAEEDLTALLLHLELHRHSWSIAEFKLEQLEDRPWVREWMDNFHPMLFGQRLWVYPSWREVPATATEAVKILLDPGLAFGTGNHPTTALCLEWLDGEDLVGKQVLDYGCGSGILAIAAAKLGAAVVVATDLDPQALEATVENARRNQLTADKIITCLPEDLPAQRYDVVIANILSGPLVTLAPTLLSYLKPQGRLALSGILADQGATVAAAYEFALENTQITAKEEWLRLEGQAKA